MPIEINALKWRSMTAAINQIQPAPKFLQDLIFKQRNPRTSEYIDVDVVIGGRKVAPFVSDTEGAVVVEKMGREMRSVKAPRIRLKKDMPANDILGVRAPGSPFYIVGGGGKVNSHRNKRIGEELKDLKDNRILTTTEWMCAQALAGGFTVTQDNLKFTIDFQMPSAHKPNISGDSAAKWNGTAPDIIANIDTWSDLILNAIGIGPDVAICGSNVVKALRTDSDVKDALDNRRKEAGSLSYDANSQYLGNLDGIDLYRYGSTYTDLAGDAQNFIPANAFILVATQARFSIEFGLIIDLDAGAQIVGELFSKSWIEKDPSVLWMLAESRPLPVPWQPEACVYATVTTT